MGIYRRKKHNSEGNEGGGNRDSGNSGQKKLTTYNDLNVDKSDINDILLPVLKEIGKCIYPPAAIPIELLYQMYKHAGAIREATSAVLKGDYDEAAKVMVKEGIKEVADMAIGAVIEPRINQASDELKESVKNNLPGDEQTKDTAANVAKGAIKGATEAVRDKVVDKTIEGAFKDEK
jgi:hypothetical protein